MERAALRTAIRAAMRTAKIKHVTTLVEKAGVTRNTIYNWETGTTAPALDELNRVAVALGVPLSTLVDAWAGVQQKEPPPDWGRLVQQVDAIVAKLGVTPAELDAAAKRVARATLAATPLPDDDADQSAPRKPRTARK